MSKTQKVLGIIEIGLVLAFGFMIYKSFHQKPVSVFGSLPQVPALFETSLAIPMGTSDTSMTLASAALKGGATLSGYYCFTLDSNTSLTEYTCGTASATLPTLITGLTRGVDPVQGTSSVASLIFSHRAGADVRITDYPALTIFQQTLNGGLSLPNPIKYDPSISTTTLTSNGSYLVNYALLQTTALAGATNATTTAQGLVQFATALQTAGGVLQGSSGAFLVPANGNFASTSSATTLVPVTQTNGKLNQNFLDLTQNFTFTGLFTDTSATTTLATTSITSLILSGKTFNFPTTNATGTLYNNGFGLMSWSTTSPIVTGNSAGRSYNVVYQNTTGHTLLINVDNQLGYNGSSCTNDGQVDFMVGTASTSLVSVSRASILGYCTNSGSTGNSFVPMFGAVPPTYFYKASTTPGVGTPGLSNWTETQIN